MKKILSLLSVVGLTSSFSSSLISCSDDAESGADVYVITDSGKVTDKSFDQSVFEGANEFESIVTKKKDTKVPYSEPKESTTASLSNVYSDVVSNSNPKVAVLSGYIHGAKDGGNNSYEPLFKKSGITGVNLDFASAGSASMGIRFYKDSSGFYAGMASIIYSILNNNVTDKTLTLGSYGGIIGDGSQFSVANYIVGYYSAVSFWNKMQAAEQKNTPDEDSPYKKFADSVIDKFGGNVETWLKTNTYKVKIAQKNDMESAQDSEWASGSFASGGGNDITTKLIHEGANVILPVAGPQITDTIETIKKLKSEAYVCGVDVDMSKTQNFNKFITSATVPLKEGTLAGVYHAESLVDKYGKNKDIQKSIKDSGIKFNDDYGNTIKADEDVTSVNTWDGKNVWMTGDVSVKGDSKQESDIDNKWTSDNNKNLLDIFSTSNLANAGSKYKSYVETGKESYQLLSKGFFDTYADYIANYTNK